MLFHCKFPSLFLLLAILTHWSMNKPTKNNPTLQFYTRAFDQLSYIFSDNSDAVASLSDFKNKFSQNQRMFLNSNNGQTANIGNENLQVDSSAGTSNNTAQAASSDIVTDKRSMVISGSKGQFVKSQISADQDSMRVYNIGEIMIPGVVAFVEVQATISRDGTYYMDAKVNEHNDGLIRDDTGIYIDSKTISRKVLVFSSKIGFGVAEVYVIAVGNGSVDFKLYTIATASNITATKVVSSVIIEITHILLLSGDGMTVEQASLTSTSKCNFEEQCTVVNLGNIKVNGDLMSKMVHAQSVAGADFEHQEAVVNQMYKLNQTAVSG